MAKKRSDGLAEIRKQYDDAKKHGTLTNGNKRKGVYSKQDVKDANKEVKKLWSGVIGSLDKNRMMGDDKFSQDMLRLGLSVADVKTMAMDMARTLESQDKAEALVEDESREETVKKRVRSVAARRIKNMNHTKTARKIARDKVKLIKAYQRAGEEGLVHPLTCGNDSSHDLLNPMFTFGTDEVVLICWDCEYIQKNIPPIVLDKKTVENARKNIETMTKRLRIGTPK